MKLYSYFRSSAAYRCRIALNLKKLPYEMEFVHLVRDGGQQKSAAYCGVNPQSLIPALEVGGGTLTQSLAIIEYLDEVHPGSKLLPGNALERAKIRAFALAIACEIHPLNNLRVLNYLKGPLARDQQTADGWYRHWTETGLEACEALLPPKPATYCFGEAPTLADVVLVPQMFNARRLKCNLDNVPRLVAIDAACQKLEAFAAAAPSVQPDAEA